MNIILLLIVCFLIYFGIGILWAKHYFKNENDDLIWYVVWNWPSDLELRVSLYIEQKLEEAKLNLTQPKKEGK
jgi:hypothetical protein